MSDTIVPFAPARRRVLRHVLAEHMTSACRTLEKLRLAHEAEQHDAARAILRDLKRDVSGLEAALQQLEKA